MALAKIVLSLIRVIDGLERGVENGALCVIVGLKGAAARLLCCSLLLHPKPLRHSLSPEAVADLKFVGMATEGDMVTFSDKHGVPGCRTVVAAANDCLHNDSHIPARQVWCEYERGVLLLRGRLATYYQKQVAQEAVRGLDGVVQIVNNIEVDW